MTDTQNDGISPDEDYHRSAEEWDFREAVEILVRAQRRLGVEACRDMIAEHLDEMREEGEDTDTDGIMLLERVSAAFEVLGGYQEGADRAITVADLTVGWSEHFQWDSSAPRRSAAYEDVIQQAVAEILTTKGAPTPDADA